MNNLYYLSAALSQGNISKMPAYNTKTVFEKLLTEMENDKIDFNYDSNKAQIEYNTFCSTEI